MRSNSKNFIFTVIFTVWVTVCLTLFVYISRVGFVQIVDVTNLNAFWEMLTHISPGNFILSLVRALAGIIIFSLSCLSLGLFILRKWLQLHSAWLVMGITAFLVGEITFSLIYLTVISLYRLPPVFVALGTLFGLLLGLMELKIFTADLLIRLRRPLLLDSYEKAIFALTMLGLLLSFSLSFSRLGYDATTYYFSHSKIMAVTQLPVFFHPNDTVVVSSFHPGILFTAIIQLFGDQAARALSWVNGISILLLCLALGKELGFSTKTSVWFLVLMFSTTAFIDLLGDGKVELISSAPIIAAICWIVQSFEYPTKQTSLLIGYLLGFAIISRPYNIFLVSVFILLMFGIYTFVQHRSERFTWRNIALSLFWMLLPILALGFFHLFQNWIWLENPLAPLLYAKKIEGGNWQWQFDPAELNLYRLLYPITLTFMNSPQSMGNISPFFISLLPLLILKNVRQNIHTHKYMKWLLVAALITLLAWLFISFTVVEIRYVFFLWIILFLAAAPVLETGIQWAGTYIRPIIIFFLSVLCIRILLIGIITYFPLDGKSKSYCADNYLCGFMDIVSQSTSPGDRVLVLHAYRYYLRQDLFACSSQVDEYSSLEKLAHQNSPDFWVEAYRLGFKLIIFEQHLSESRYQFGNLPSPDIAPPWMVIKLLYTNTDETQQIYKIETINPPTQPEISCRQDTAGRWQLTR